jgi:choline-glycine betaine transporter
MTELWWKIVITYLVLMTIIAIPFFYPPILIDLRVICLVAIFPLTLFVLLAMIALNPDYDEDLIKKKRRKDA